MGALSVSNSRTASHRDAVLEVSDHSRGGACKSAVLFSSRSDRSLRTAGILALRKHPVLSLEVTGVATRTLLEIVLMLRLGLPEVAHGLDLGDDLAVPQPRRIHVGDRIFGDALLLLVDVVDT